MNGGLNGLNDVANETDEETQSDHRGIREDNDDMSISVSDASNGRASAHPKSPKPVSSDKEKTGVELLSSRLEPGSVFDSLDSAYIIYCEYARIMGFSVRKGTQSYFRKTDTMRMKLYHCSCEGHTDTKATIDKVAEYRKQHTRTDCKARLRVVRDADGPWKVSVFWQHHNHPLLDPDNSYLLRSSRNLSHAKRSILETFNAAGIGVSNAFRYLEKDAGGRENVGFTRKDAYDHIRDVRMVSKLKNYDADALLKFFQEKAFNEPYFFWKVLLDDEGRLMNFYFRDCQSADDYESFGDVVSIDTTFRTNKYNLICAPFVGMNHHRQNILFGLAFLSDETTQSFEWLFSTFLESMQDKEPGVIFSDQDQALVNAIDSTFCEATHRLCQWHINQNAPAHFGKLNGDRQFRKMWFHCMNGCETESEFEETWNRMITTYCLQDNRWFNNMYAIRERWSDVFSNDKFTGGLRATSRSEVTNKVIKDLCASSSSLSEFVLHFESIIRDWRIREREEDVFCRGAPGQRIDGNCLLKHAAHLYTRNVYKLFEREAISCLNVKIINSLVDSVGGDMSFTLTADDDPRERLVVYNALGNLVSCTCQMLVTDGIFCRHILKVFYTLNILELPQQYIMQRWTREAKVRATNSWTNQLSISNRGPEMLFVNSLMRMTYDLAGEVKDMEPIRKQTLDKFTGLIAEIKMMITPCNEVRTKGNSRKKVLKQREFRDPPIPKHRWLPHKRRSTLLDKKCSTKGKEKLRKMSSLNTRKSDFLPTNSEDTTETLETLNKNPCDSSAGYNPLSWNKSADDNTMFNS